ncbi:MAG: hypothetical protein AB7H97_09415 [Pseudobdellovibrionaceae bacterium]
MLFPIRVFTPILTLVLMLFSAVSFAEVFSFRLEGEVTRAASANQAYVRSRDGRVFPIYFQNSEVRKTFEKINNGDFVSGLGELRDDNSVHLRIVEYVGLRALIGFWKSQNQFFVFKDFSNLKLYSSDRTQVVQYSTAPGTDRGWKIFFADGSTITLASLYLDHDEALMTLYDSESGKVTDQVKLKKIRYPSIPAQAPVHDKK